jgi:acyl-coenzyme A synthetase/AMP-(fatty) acid ligase
MKVIFAGQLPKTGSAKICKFKLREMYGKKKMIEEGFK